MKIFSKQVLRSIVALATVLLITNCGNIVPDSDAETATNCSNGCSWAQQAYLKANNAETNDLFGSSVALDGDTIVVAAIAEDSNTGAAYVFVGTPN